MKRKMNMNKKIGLLLFALLLALGRAGAEVLPDAKCISMMGVPLEGPDSVFVPALQEIGFVRKRFHILPITDAIEQYARLRVNLERKGENIDDFDLLIAATAQTSGLTLVTHNLRHFERIGGLRIEDWDRMS